MPSCFGLKSDYGVAVTCKHTVLPGNFSIVTSWVDSGDECSFCSQDEIVVKLTAERENLRKLLPRCNGEWIGGSGGHRKYSGGCDSPGVWDIGVGFVCDAHKNRNGGDDDAVTLETALDQEQVANENLRQQLTTVRNGLNYGEKVCAELVSERDTLRDHLRLAEEMIELLGHLNEANVRLEKARDAAAAERDHYRSIAEAGVYVTSATIEARVVEGVAAWLGAWAPNYMLERDFGVQNEQVGKVAEMLASQIREGAWKAKLSTPNAEASLFDAIDAKQT